jgi:methyl-accepting chemotaxis protein
VRRFVFRFVLGAVAMLVAYEVVQSMSSREEETVDEAWLVAGTTHALLAEAFETEPPPRTPAALAARLGVPVAALTEADWQVAQGRALFSTRDDGIELVVLPMDEESWRVVAALPSGPVAIDAWALFEEHDEAVDLAHLLSLMVLALGMTALGVALVAPPARQLRRLAQTARALEDGDLTARTEVPHGGLVAPVARAMNAMAAQIQRVVG